MPTTLSAVLFELRDEATGLTQRIAAQDAAEGVGTTPQKFGSINDAVFKALVNQAISDERLPSTFRTAPASMNNPGTFGIDVWDRAIGQGWDLTTATSRQVLNHERYVGQSMPDGTVILQVNPLVYSR